MSFQNGATLELVGESAKLESGDISVINSSVRLGLGGTKLTADNSLVFNGASVDIASAAKLNAPGVNVYGINTLALPQEDSATNYSVSAGVIVIKPDSRLTLSGHGSVASDFLLDWSAPGAGQQYGQLLINDNASLVNTQGHFIVCSAAPVTINRTGPDVYGSLIVKDGGGIDLLGLTGFTTPFVNRGLVSAYADGGITVPGGTYTVLGGGQGVINIGDAGWLQIGNPGTAPGASALLLTDNAVQLDNFSTLKLTLDATARTSSQLRTLGVLFISNFAELNLSLVGPDLFDFKRRVVERAV